MNQSQKTKLPMLHNITLAFYELLNNPLWLKTNRLSEYFRYDINFSRIAKKNVYHSPDSLENPSTMDLILTYSRALISSVLILVAHIMLLGYLMPSSSNNSFPIDYLFLNFGVMIGMNLFLGLSSQYLLISQIHSIAIRSIILVMFFRDPNNDFEMFDYSYLDENWTYKNIVSIIEFYLYPEKEIPDNLVLYEPSSEKK